MTNTEVATAVKGSLAIHFDINRSSIDVVVQQLRRLGQEHSLRRLDSSWMVDFTIVVPQNEFVSVQAKMNETRDDEASFANLMQEQLAAAGVQDSAATISGLNFETSVVVSSTTGATDFELTTGASDLTIVSGGSATTSQQQAAGDNAAVGQDDGIVIVVIAVLGILIIGASVGACCCCCRCRSRHSREGSLFVSSWSSKSDGNTTGSNSWAIGHGHEGEEEEDEDEEEDETEFSHVERKRNLRRLGAFDSPEGIACENERDARILMQVVQDRYQEGDDMVYFFIQRDIFLNLDSTQPMPSFADLRREGQLTAHLIKMEDAVNGMYRDTFVVVSHRWRTWHHPDEDSDQLKAVQEQLRESPRIQWVWIDWPCMPQTIHTGDGEKLLKKTRLEKKYFARALTNINVLYLYMHCIILLDMQYCTRFWCLLEAYLATHTLTPDGILFSEDQERYHIIKMYTAEDPLVQQLIHIVDKTDEEMLTILANDDIMVTNMADKKGMIKKMSSWLREQVGNIERARTTIWRPEQTACHEQADLEQTKMSEGMDQREVPERAVLDPVLVDL